MRLSSARVKSCQIPHANFETRSQFFFKLCIILHCHDTSSVNFKLMHFLLWFKVSIKVPGLRHLSGLMKIFHISHVIFQTTIQFFFQILHYSLVSWKITPLYFFRTNVIYFAQKEPIKVETLRISSAQVKVDQNLVIFETTNQFFFEFCITLQCHET